MSSNEFFNVEDILKRTLDGYADELHAKAASIVDPETGKHSPVFVRRVGEKFFVETTGSQAYALELERRMGLEAGQVRRVSRGAKSLLVYLAHATEDKAIARPLAEGLVARGIDVWFDQWEIGAGDSVRRKMDQGLGDCTHFIVLLTETSLTKRWVNEEVDAGLLAAVEGEAKFVGLRHQLPFASLPPLLKTRLSLEFAPGEDGLDALAAQIRGVSDKPPLGPAPRYVKSPEGSPWSAAALNLAEWFVRNSRTGHKMDPQATYEQLQEATGMPLQEVRLGALDLIGSGMLEKSKTIGVDRVWALADLFTEFDGMFLEQSPEEDAKALAVHLFNSGKELVASEEVAKELDWEPRRFNPAAHWLVAARIVREYSAIGGPYVPYRLRCGDELVRFVRSL